MFDKILKFFIQNYKLNYAIFFLIYAFGIYAYLHIPKEVSPVIEPDSITIRGDYRGASIDSLNTMAVNEIEHNIKNIDGVDSVSSTITNGRFSITVELKSGANKDKVSKDIEDSIKTISLPDDMDEPTIRSVPHSRSIINVAILSNKISRDELLTLASDIKDKLLKIKDISSVTIYGDADKIIEILLDENKLKAYHLNITDITKSISELSYIYPLGKIDNKKDKFYLSVNTIKSIDELKNAFLDIDNQTIKLSDIATIKKKFDNSNTLASMNGKNSITLAISQNATGDAITIVKHIQQLINSIHIKDVELKLKRDHSKIVKNSLNVIFSNILFGIILIIVLMSALINFRIAFVIALGIPTSFILGAIYFYITGYSINVNSLVGVLLAIGIIVDDAIVVSENIYQYINKGLSPKEAAYLGTKEMAKPVTIASLTTIFAFIPLLMIDGRLGNIISLIPIALSALILASLIESFIFLPIHSVHILKNHTKTISWYPINKIYKNLLKFIIKYNKIYIPMFILIVTIATFYSAKNLKFFIFNKVNSNSITITFRATPNTSLDDSLYIIQTIEKDLLKQKKDFFIKDIASTAGYRRSPTGDTQMYPYVGNITLELYDMKENNFFEKYITPYLSLYHNTSQKLRNISSSKIAKRLRLFLKKHNYKQKFNLDSINVVEKRIGYTKADIRIGIVSNNYKLSLQALQALENKLSHIKGIKYFGDNVTFGIDEVKIKLNNYGQQLGLSEHYVSNYIANLFLEKEIGKVSDNKQLLDIKVKSINQNDLSSFKNIQIPLKDNSYIELGKICDIKREKALEKLTKDDGDTTFFIYANIDSKTTTDNKVLKQLKPIMDKYKNQNIQFKLKGEAYQKRKLKDKFFKATILAIILIFISILYLFNSIRNTLIVMSVIPLSLFGVFIGHHIMHINLTLPSLIGALGLSGIIINDGIIMMDTIKDKYKIQDILESASRRLRPIILTTITTIAGLSSLIFFASLDAKMFQPIAISLGFGLLWGTIVNLIYLPVFYITLNKKISP